MLCSSRSSLRRRRALIVEARFRSTLSSVNIQGAGGQTIPMQPPLATMYPPPPPSSRQTKTHSNQCTQHNPPAGLALLRSTTLAGGAGRHCCSSTVRHWRSSTGTGGCHKPRGLLLPPVLGARRRPTGRPRGRDGAAGRARSCWPRPRARDGNARRLHAPDNRSLSLRARQTAGPVQALPRAAFC